MENRNQIIQAAISAERKRIASLGGKAFAETLTERKRKQIGRDLAAARAKASAKRKRRK